MTDLATRLVVAGAEMPQELKMANTWKPKKSVTCPECSWSGLRAVVARSCPKCGFWHPTTDGHRPGVWVLWHPEGKPTLAKSVKNARGNVYAKSDKGDWWLLSGKSDAGWRSPALKIKREIP